MLKLCGFLIRVYGARNNIGTKMVRSVILFVAVDKKKKNLNRDLHPPTVPSQPFFGMSRNGGALRDIPKNGCEGDQLACGSCFFLRLLCSRHVVACVTTE